MPNTLSSQSERMRSLCSACQMRNRITFHIDGRGSGWKIFVPIMAPPRRHNLVSRAENDSGKWKVPATSLPHLMDGLNAVHDGIRAHRPGSPQLPGFFFRETKE